MKYSLHKFEIRTLGRKGFVCIKKWKQKKMNEETENSKPAKHHSLMTLCTHHTVVSPYQLLAKILEEAAERDSLKRRAFQN